MPGRLLSMEQSQDLKKDRSHAQEHALPPKPDFTVKQPAPQVNGPTNISSNGAISNGAPMPDGQPATNGGSAGQPSLPTSTPVAPALDQSWRESDSNKSMGTLIERLSHQCFADLDSTLTEMSATTFPQQSGQANGVIPGQVDSNADSLNKKRSFMQFAQGQRDRFIKTLILTDWAENAGEDMAKLVDIKVFQEKQQNAHHEAIKFIGHSKNDTRAAKMPNPNIEGALELLTTGRATRVPDLGFLPPKRLTAKQLLRTLQNMNVILSARLNLNEELPAHFNDFSIANGRATFRVAGEFEVDLSVADEDPATPFYFIDIRFLFSPTPVISHDRLRSELEQRANAELATNGLKGCYNFLHNFVLTHKINVLRDQAERIQKEKVSDKWFGCVYADKRNRVFTIQYWAGLPGRKSWLEFGVSTGKDPKSKSSQPPTPRIVTRWFRRGDLVRNDSLDVDWNDIDIEKVLSTVTAKHASWTLDSIRGRLQAMDSKLVMDLKSSETGSGDESLELSLPGLASPIVVRFESITGRLSLSPTTRLVADLERRLNGNTEPDYSEALASLLCQSVRYRIDNAAKLVGWQPLAHGLRSDALRSAFGAHRTHRAYTCSTSWGTNWTLFVTFSLSGEQWWAVRIEEQPATAGSAPIKAIKEARKLREVDILTARSTISRSSLLQVEKMAVAEVSFAVLSQQLASKDIRFKTEKIAPLTFEEGSAITETQPKLAVFFRGSTLLKDSVGKDFVVDFIRLTHQGHLLLPGGEDGANMCHELRMTVKTGKLKYLKEHLTTKSRDADVAMNASNALALKFRTPFGQPYLDQIISRLQGCDRLDHALAAMHKYKCTCNTISFKKVAFTYSTVPELGVTITFSGPNDGLPASLKLEPEGLNPHKRARSILEKAFNFNSAHGEGFDVLCNFLRQSLEVYRAFDRIESRDSAKDTLTINTRSPVVYQMKYRAPPPAFSFTLELKTRSAGTVKVASWKLSADHKKRADLLASDVGKAIMELGMQKSEHFRGFEDGALAAPASGAGEMILKVDEIMQKFAGTGEAASSAPAQPVNGTVKQEAQARPQAPKQQTSSQKPPTQQRPSSTQQKPPHANAKPPPAPIANMTGNVNRNNQGKVKKEVIELD